MQYRDPVASMTSMTITQTPFLFSKPRPSRTRNSSRDASTRHAAPPPPVA